MTGSTTTNGPGTGTGSNPWRIFTLLAVVQFMVVLDAGIVYVALPSIQRQMDISPTGLAWVMDAYMLAFGGFMLLGGRAADLFGRRPVFLTGLVVFAAASLACGLATEAWQLIAARAGQGLGAALVSPAAMALTIDLFDGHDRHKALGIFGGIGGLAGATGVLFGGLLTSVGWQWTFLVNVPIILVVLVRSLRLVPSTGHRAVGGLDLVGALTSTGGLCLALYGILRLGGEGWGTGVALALAGSALLLLAFLARQLLATAPLIPRALFRIRAVVLGNLANTVVGALMFGVFFVVTLYLQAVRGYSPLGAALATAPISLALFAGSQVTIRLFGRIRPVSALAAGLLVQAFALADWALVLAPRGHILTSFVLPGMLWGAGLGASVVAAFVVCTSGLTGPVQGAASGMVSTTLQIGGAVGLGVLSATASRRTATVLTGDTDPVEAMAAGHTLALGVAAVLAVLAVPLVVWARHTRHTGGAAVEGNADDGGPDTSRPTATYAEGDRQ
jgi:EmrB/QacA subfamily drug resistance transporter